MKVLLADDQPGVRSAISLLLEQEVGGWQVVGEATQVQELVDEARASHPDLVLMDWELPGLQPEGTGGSSFPASRVIRSLRASCPQTKFIVLSGRPEARPEALAAGVDGFISKGDPPDGLLQTLRDLSMDA